jgi:Putative beta-lactamase-inhibitor-like, PepSY-like
MRVVEVLMNTRHLKWLVGGLFTTILAGLLLAVPAACAQDKLDLDKIPKKVMDALKAKFPKAKIHKWTKEKEGTDVVYDLEFKQDTRKFEADIKEDGTISNWEKEIAAKDLPEAVKKTVDGKYPRSILKEIMAITAVKDGKDAPEGYEIVLETAHTKEVEVTVAPDGKLLEDSGEKK